MRAQGAEQVAELFPNSQLKHIDPNDQVERLGAEQEKWPR